MLWLVCAAQLISVIAAETVCCDTVTFPDVSFAQASGHNAENCELGECKSLKEKIKNIVVLMLENRSFDHMLGFLSETRDDIDGCTPEMGPKCSCPVDPEDTSNKEVVYVSNDAVHEQPTDPQHKIGEVTFQIYGTNDIGNSIDIHPAPMNGFIKSYEQVLPGNGSFIMKSFNADTLPVMTSLVNEFGVIDHWFAGIPGETQPNRVMAMRSHTNGFIRNTDVMRLVSGFDGLNIFSMLDEYKTDDPEPWRVYSGDFPNVLSLKSTRQYPERFSNMKDFYAHTEDGTLPFLSWVEPSYFDMSCDNPSTSEHANQHDVRNGELLIRDMYNALRSSPQWNDTLFFIYYDEHGGFFDHVPPPSAPNPDGVDSVETEYPYGPSFDFKRLGVRVPAVLISPWIRRATTDPVVAPNGDSQYCHSSLIHTIRKNWIPDAPPLSKREEWSLTFEHLINLNSPRDDTPDVLHPGDIPKPSPWIDCDDYRLSKLNISDTELSEAQLISGLLGVMNQYEEFISSQKTLGEYVMGALKEYLAKQMKEKLTKCKTAGCSGELCVKKDTEDGMASTCVMKCEYECLQYQSCKYDRKSGECGWNTNFGLDSLKYKKCMRLCDEINELHDADDVKEEL